MPPKNKEILIVEDEVSIREVLKDFLELEGFRVQVAGNGQEALDILEKMGHPCVVLLDLFMPVMDGITFLSTLRQESGDIIATLPVIIISAGAPQSTQVQTARSLANGYIKKPMDLDIVLEIVKRYCC